MPSQRPAAIEKIVSRFQQTTDPKRRYEQLLWFAKKLDPLPADQKIPANKVPGCVSQVFVLAHLDQGRVVYQADSDAQITKGLVALLVQGLTGLTPQEILDLSPDFIQDTHLDVSLTPSRANGFYNIFKKMQTLARDLAAEESLPIS
ncbi:MAG: SufE family protein [Cyanobacteria bacterium REEB459]|nr:SufE family protein [Cyanobacteria bacterium REEB459]